MVTNTKIETDNIKTKYSSIFVPHRDKVGDIGTIADGIYNKNWIIYTISGNTYQVFPMQNLTTHRMNPTDTNAGGYYISEMYKFIHNEVLSNLKRSGLNITSCDLVSYAVYMDIVSKTGVKGNDIAGGEIFWLTDPYSSSSFYGVASYGSINASSNGASFSLGVRPLITIVK